MSDLDLTPEFILKNGRNLNEDQIVQAILTPELTKAFVAISPRLNEEQLKIAAPLMPLEMIRAVIPKLQLQQTGVAVQVMSPPQVRQVVLSLPREDRQLLQENISLLSNSSNKDELQSFMGFVDPLALCMAIQIPSLSRRIIEAAGVMTLDQLRVVVPLMTANQIRDLFSVIEDDVQVETATSMIDIRDQIRNVLIEDLPVLEAQCSELYPKIEAVTNQLTDAENKVKEKAGNFDDVARYLKTIKSEIETLSKIARSLQSSFKLPLKVFHPTEHQSGYQRYQKMSQEISQVNKDLNTKYLKLDSLIHTMNSTWSKSEAPIPEKSPKSTNESPTDIFEDSDLAVVLYEAVKQIGNPAAIGSYYTMQWNDIIRLGFRSVNDFHAKGIRNLEQLQQYIDSHK